MDVQAKGQDEKQAGRICVQWSLLRVLQGRMWEQSSDALSDAPFFTPSNQRPLPKWLEIAVVADSSVVNFHRNGSGELGYPASRDERGSFL